MSRVAFSPPEVVFRIDTLFTVIVGERTSEVGYRIAAPSEIIGIERSGGNYWTTGVIIRVIFGRVSRCKNCANLNSA